MHKRTHSLKVPKTFRLADAANAKDAAAECLQLAARKPYATYILDQAVSVPM